VYLDFLCRNFGLEDLKKFMVARKELQEVPVPV
jgi:hypothetical protein